MVERSLLNNGGEWCTGGGGVEGKRPLGGDRVDEKPQLPKSYKHQYSPSTLLSQICTVWGWKDWTQVGSLPYIPVSQLRFYLWYLIWFPETTRSNF